MTQNDKNHESIIQGSESSDFELRENDLIRDVLQFDISKDKNESNEKKREIKRNMKLSQFQAQMK